MIRETGITRKKKKRHPREKFLNSKIDFSSSSSCVLIFSIQATTKRSFVFFSLLLFVYPNPRGRDVSVVKCQAKGIYFIALFGGGIIDLQHLSCLYVLSVSTLLVSVSFSLRHFRDLGLETQRKGQPTQNHKKKEKREMKRILGKRGKKGPSRSRLQLKG